MTKRKYRNQSYLFFFFSSAFSVLLIRAALSETGLGRIISCVMFSILIFLLLRVALLLRQKSKDLDLK